VIGVGAMTDGRKTPEPPMYDRPRPDELPLGVPHTASRFYWSRLKASARIKARYE
jgi:hypothetical protein